MTTAAPACVEDLRLRDHAQRHGVETGVDEHKCYQSAHAGTHLGRRLDSFTSHIQ